MKKISLIRKLVCINSYASINKNMNHNYNILNINLININFKAK